jgi:hypothetical protein
MSVKKHVSFFMTVPHGGAETSQRGDYLRDQDLRKPDREIRIH